MFLRGDTSIDDVLLLLVLVGCYVAVFRGGGLRTSGETACVKWVVGGLHNKRECFTKIVFVSL